MGFTEEEIAFIQSQPLARLSTVDAQGQPDVVPVGLEWDGEYFWVGGPPSVVNTRKFRNLAAGNGRVAVVVDDLVSFDPFVARGIRIYGVADQPHERVGMVGPGVYLRIKTTVSWSWNMAGEPAGEQWYPSRKAIH